LGSSPRRSRNRTHELSTDQRADSKSTTAPAASAAADHSGPVGSHATSAWQAAHASAVAATSLYMENHTWCAARAVSIAAGPAWKVPWAAARRPARRSGGGTSFHTPDAAPQ